MFDENQPANNSLVYRNDESNIQPEFYSDIFETQQYNQLELQIQKNEEKHRQHMHQLETVEMMSKYQLVFTKMEAAINRVSSFFKVRESLHKYKGFVTIKKISTQNIQLIALQAKTYEKQFEMKICTLAYIIKKKILFQEQKGFKKILLTACIKKLEKKQRDEQELRKREWVSKLTQKDDEIDRVKKKYEELESIFWQSKQNENELLQRIQQKSRNIQRLENDGIEQKRVQPNSMTNKQSQWESKLKELDNNNAQLNAQYQQSQTFLSSFVRDMNDLLDSHGQVIDFQEEDFFQLPSNEISSHRGVSKNNNNINKKF